MTQTSDNRTLSFGDGTSQQQRRLDALDPDFVKIDEREVEDFLVFALQLADRLKYYDLDNRSQGAEGPYNWQPFFQASTSVVIADIQATNPLLQKRRISSLLAGPDTPDALRKIFDGLLALARAIDQWERSVDPQSGLRGHIGRLIDANLSTALGRLVAYEMAAVEHLDGYEHEGYVDEHGDILPTRYMAGGAVFGSKWNLGDPQAVAADASLFGGFEDVDDQIAAAKKRLEEIFLTLYNTYTGIIQAAPRYFDASVDGRSDHRPHIALFLAFLKLYLQVRDDANRLTGRHLDFFYEQVIGLTRKAAEPDHVHLVVTPSAAVFQAQGIDEYQIAAGTAVDAGADAMGVDRRYTLDNNLVANLARIASLKTVYVNTESADVPENPAAVQSIHVAPVANSGDGEGGAFEDEESPSWPTLGSADMPHATIGFAVASRALLLREGEREVTLDLHCAHLPADLDSGKDSPLAVTVDIALSGEEGWIEPAEITAEVVDVSTEQIGNQPVRKGTLRLSATLPSTESPVTFSNSEVLGADYGTTLPMIRVRLRPAENAGETFAYEVLKTLLLEKITLGTNVTGDGVRTLVVQNDQFVMDAGKSFQPFGSFPKTSSNFFIGSSELFEKNLTSLTLHIDWEGLPASFASHYEGYYDTEDAAPSASDFTVDVSLRQDKSWIPLRPSEDSPEETPPAQLFAAAEDPITLASAELASQKPREVAALEPFDVTSQNGFLRLTLSSQDFNHDLYPSVLTRQTLAAGKYSDPVPGARYKNSAGEIVVATHSTSTAPGEPIIPREPYTPTIKSLRLTYGASINSDDSPELFEFIHLPAFEGGYEAKEVSGAAPHLLPEFEYQRALYVGFENLQPRQSLTVLIQVAEGTADPELEKAEVQWEYLSSNEWLEFEDYEIASDTTNELTTSGIITFTIPDAIDRTNTTVLPAAYHWIRGFVTANEGAVSQVIGIHTQAVRATFADQGNDPNHLQTPLPAETISGLLFDDAAVDSVAQPYPSFGGRPAEQSMSFYTRVSEHLRHKGRAVARFDYERLVLEEFPDIYKVKCIRHTNEAHRRAPGHVLLAVIPDFTNLPAANRRTPRVTLARLDEIRMFLEDVNCPFVRADAVGPGGLHVLNPVYEEVRVSFSVRFLPSVTAISYHVEELKTAIVRFLSPWAFAGAADISFGGRLYKSTILNFVEERPYVDYVTDFKMMHRESTTDADVIEVETPRSILVPAVEARQDVHPLDAPYTTVKNPLAPEGIGSMTVADDFRVSSP